MSLGGVRLTTPLRTALDLGCALSRPEALAAFDAFARLHGVSRDDLEACLPRYRGRRGVVRMRQLVPLVDARSESPGESRSRLLIHDEGLPPPVPQFWVLSHGQPLYRLDLAWPKHRVAVEYDGAWHELTDSQRVADRARRDWLHRHGWTVIVIRSGELGRGTAQPWLRDLRVALDR